MKKLYILLAFVMFTTAAVEAQVKVTFRVTLKGTGRRLNADSLRVAGMLGATEQADWTPAVSLKMKPTGTPSDSIFAITLTVTRPATGPLEYKFLNGGTWGNGTTDPTEDERGLGGLACAGSNGNRNYTIPTGNGPFTIPVYKFNTCDIVIATGTNELSTAANMDVFPNPADANTTLTFDNPSNAAHSLEILNITGQVVRTYAAQSGTQFTIERGNISAGIYFARVKNAIGESKTTRFVFN